MVTCSGAGRHRHGGSAIGVGVFVRSGAGLLGVACAWSQILACGSLLWLARGIVAAANRSSPRPDVRVGFEFQTTATRSPPEALTNNKQHKPASSGDIIVHQERLASHSINRTSATTWSWLGILFPRPPSAGHLSRCDGTADNKRLNV
jgi:hypothetical protein